MSRSRKRPYAAICGNGSARYDKKLAGCGVRRKQNHWLRNQADNDNFLLPHKLECHHNNTWGWSRDDKQFLRLPTPQDRAYHQQWIQGRYTKGLEENWLKKNYSQWPPRWYARLTRK
jgi:hypothetical protein